MVEFAVSRAGILLRPVSASDMEEMVRLPERRIITITAEPVAQDKVKRWYRAMVQTLVEATGRWPNTEVAHRELLLRSGFFSSMVIDKQGSARFTPESTANWGSIQWRDYLDKVVPLIIEDYAPDARREFRSKVDRHLGITYKEAINGS